MLDSGPCAYCGDPNPNVVDHILPVSRGGTADRANLAPACKPCNDNKLDFTPEEWKAWRIEEGMPWPPKSLLEQIREIAIEHGLDVSRPLPDEDGAFVADKTTTTPGRGLSRPLKELIGIPSDEQLLTAARILGLVEGVQRRLDREAAARKGGEAA